MFILYRLIHLLERLVRSLALWSLSWQHLVLQIPNSVSSNMCFLGSIWNTRVAAVLSRNDFTLLNTTKQPPQCGSPHRPRIVSHPFRWTRINPRGGRGGGGDVMSHARNIEQSREVWLIHAASRRYSQTLYKRCVIVFDPVPNLNTLRATPF